MHTNTPETASNPNGRPPCVPTDEHRERVRVLGRHGVPHVEIAASLGISVPTLRNTIARI